MYVYPPFPISKNKNFPINALLLTDTWVCKNKNSDDDPIEAIFPLQPNNKQDCLKKKLYRKWMESFLLSAASIWRGIFYKILPLYCSDFPIYVSFLRSQVLSLSATREETIIIFSLIFTRCKVQSYPVVKCYNVPKL